MDKKHGRGSQALILDALIWLPTQLLGLPFLMRRVRYSFGTSIYDIPALSDTAILQNISSYLTDPKDLLSFSQVCQFWRAVVYSVQSGWRFSHSGVGHGIRLPKRADRIVALVYLWTAVIAAWITRPNIRFTAFALMLDLLIIIYHIVWEADELLDSHMTIRLFVSFASVGVTAGHFSYEGSLSRCCWYSLYTCILLFLGRGRWETYRGVGVGTLAIFEVSLCFLLALFLPKPLRIMLACALSGPVSVALWGWSVRMYYKVTLSYYRVLTVGLGFISLLLLSEICLNIDYIPLFYFLPACMFGIDDIASTKRWVAPSQVVRRATLHR